MSSSVLSPGKLESRGSTNCFYVRVEFLVWRFMLNKTRRFGAKDTKHWVNV